MAADELVAYLRGLPDDWASWLVYADTLTERGDLRGELLVLEHRIASGDVDAPALRMDAGALAEAWIETWRAQHVWDDGDLLVWLRTLAPLAAPPTPADLAPVLARPIGQLLALLEPGEMEWSGVSPVLAQHRDRVFAAVLAWIDRAFDGVPVPDEHHRTIHQAEAADSYESCDRSRDHLGRWQDLPTEHLLGNQWALPHLDEQGIQYYLPAAMSFALHHRMTPYDGVHWITESLQYTLEPSGPDLRDYEQRRLRLLDRDQRAAIYAFTLAAGHATAAAAWGRVFEAERAAARVDWFALYSPPP